MMNVESLKVFDV